MRTAQEYAGELKVIREGIDILWQCYRDEQRSSRTESEKLARLKELNQGIISLEDKANYLSSQRKKAERVEAREDAYIKSFDAPTEHDSPARLEQVNELPSEEY